MIGAFHFADRMVAGLEKFVALLAMIGLTGLLVAQVIFRYLLGAPLFFAEEVALLLLIVASFTGLSLLVFERRMVAVELLGQMLGARGRAALRWLMAALVLVLAVALACFAWRYISVPWVWSEQSATFPMPRAVIQLYFAVQMILLSMHQAIALFTSRTGSQSVEVAA
jgi:TRAP-type C4-dicarboxylate transport system permease small subunit